MAVSAMIVAPHVVATAVIGPIMIAAHAEQRQQELANDERAAHDGTDQEDGFHGIPSGDSKTV
jgi:hypothetical protein